MQHPWTRHHLWSSDDYRSSFTYTIHPNINRASDYRYCYSIHRYQPTQKDQEQQGLKVNGDSGLSHLTLGGK